MAIAKSLHIDEITTSHFANAPRNDINGHLERSERSQTHPNLPLKREGTEPHLSSPLAVEGKRRGFTLAEVLITLGIIGVVAALTLPSVITKYQKQDTVVRLKKVYSVMSNAVDMSIADNGDMDTWDFPESSYYDVGFIPFFRKYYIPYLKIAEECVASNCFMKENYKPISYSGSDKSGCAYAGYLVKLSDGTYLYFLSNIGAGYIWMFADINGKKKPNVIGKDIFVFDIYKYNRGGYKVKFWNIGETVDYLVGSQGYGCNKEATEFQGFNCGALIQKSGWKIPDNYPW